MLAPIAGFTLLMNRSFKYSNRNMVSRRRSKCKSEANDEKCETYIPDASSIDIDKLVEWRYE